MRWALVSIALVALSEAPPPVEMTAKGGLEVDLKAQRGTARGDVTIRRGDVVVCCDTADAEFEQDQVTRVECRGRVVIVRADGTRARADRAVFDARADRVTLTGGARLRSPRADLEGAAIVYDIAKDKLEVHGSHSRFRLAPKERPAEGPPERACPPEP